MNAECLPTLAVYSFAALLTLSAIGMAFLATYAQVKTGRL